jgi:hypothetical protein
MLDDIYCNQKLLSLNHGLNGYPIIKMTYTEYGAGIGGAGDFPAGADSECNLMQNKAVYKDRNNIDVYVPQDYYIANPSINKINYYKYVVTFTNSTRSILIELIEGDIQNQVNENTNNINQINTKLDTKAINVDNNRTTEDKTVTGAINELDSNLDTVNFSLSQSSNVLIPTNASTANAILLSISSFANYKKYSFKANANSTSNVTINGKAFKKYDGTQIGNGGIKSGKVYDFYYESSSDSVFILAKAEGNATVADVLAPKIFSNGDDTGLIGCIPSKTAQTYNPSTTVQIIASGQYLSEPQTIAPVTGTANVNDVVSGKIFSSVNGINLVGQATIESLGGRMYKSGSVLFPNYGSSITITLGFTPNIVYLGNPSRIFYASFISNTAMYNTSTDSQNSLEQVGSITILDNGFTVTADAINSNKTVNYEAWG